MVPAYVEVGVALASDSGVAAWSYEPELWGRCGQGPDEATALAALTDRPTVVVERAVGDEQAFSADLRPATPAQHQAPAPPRLARTLRADHHAPARRPLACAEHGEWLHQELFLM